MRTYLILYLTGQFAEQKVRWVSPWYYQVGEVKFNGSGRFRVLEVLK